MNLPVPVTGVDPGPDYANNVNTSLNTVDSHDHTTGKGVPITPQGMNINIDLPFNGNNAITLRSTRYALQGSPLNGASDLACLYFSGVDLYANDANGDQIRLTQNGNIAGTSGSIANLNPPASAAYVTGSGTFVFQSGSNLPGNLDAASVTFRDQTVGSPGMTMNANAAIASNFDVTWLAAPPSSTMLLSMDSAGNISASSAPSQLTPTGSITMFGGTAAPTGFLLCDGTAYSRTTYAVLFGIIGTNYGVGDGSTTFNVPDFRGIFPRGVDNGAGNDPDSASRTAVNGGNSGDNVGSLEAQATAVNGLALSDPGHGHTYLAYNSAVGGSTYPQLNQAVANVNQPTSANVTGITLSSTQTETRPINLYVNFIIKT